ncbi:MAG: SMP-30/gluconolactonase/LRE family protein, partial [Geminicoccaceae bacterium]|nr:SMP-30/gluconolactonase/LRE family protein [Geminicoccaceae bacterium]
SRFLAGSLSKRMVAAVAPNGATTSFIAPRSDILRVVGMHIDASRRRLWFATWGPAATGGSDTTETPSLTRLFLAELPSGRIVKSWVPDGGRAGHALNDFVVMNDGGLILTDTEQGALYRLRSPDDTLELFVQPDANRLSTANGIAITPDQRTLYVAFVEGLVRVDVATRAIVPIPAPDTVSTAAIDGLYWFRGDLIAVQGIPTLARVVRYRLSGAGDRIVSGAVLERGQPLINEPTTGTIVGSRFYYIANSQYGRLDERGAIEPRTGPATRTVVRAIDLR